MKKYANELSNGEQIEKVAFSVIELQEHKSKNGDPYYNIRLADKTGEIMGKIWADNFSNCDLSNVAVGVVVDVWGKISEYKGKPQLIVYSLVKSESYDISDMMKITDRDIDKMWDEMLDYMNSVENKHLKKLLDDIFSDEDIVKRYRSSPAAERVHHGFVGGLLEHTLEMLDFAKPYSKYYPEADYDLVVAGIILHDIGKIFEIEQKGVAFEFGIEGALVGHIQLGLEYIDSVVSKDMPRKLLIHLKHIIISHHGDFADVKPVTMEAAIVSVVDFGSSRVRQYKQMMEDGESKPEDISEYSKFLDSRVYIGNRDWEN